MSAAAQLCIDAGVPIPIVPMFYHCLSYSGREAGKFLRRDEVAQHNVTVLAKLLPGARWQLRPWV